MTSNDQHESVTEWIFQLQNSQHDDAAQRLWERYMSRLVDRARRKLGGTSKKMADEEDVAIIAFENFCRGAKNGRFPKLKDRDDLWQLLIVLTDRRAIDQMRKRSHSTGEGSGIEFESIESVEPTPEFIAEMGDNIQTLMDSLEDKQLQQLVMHKLAAHSNEEITELLDCSLRTVERKLNMVRKRWRSVAKNERTCD